MQRIHKMDRSQVSSFSQSNHSWNSRQLLKQIEEINSALKNFSSKSEKAFLEIGNKLQSIYKDSKNIAGYASSIVSTISTDILQKGIAELELLLNDIGSHLSAESDKIFNDKNQLLNTHSKLSNIDNELDGFDKIVKRLRMLGISTKIESARLNIEDDGFFTLAENVDKLSNIINEKILLIKQKAEFLLVELMRTVTNLTSLEKKQCNEADIIMSKTIKSLNSFNEKRNGLSEKIKMITELSEEVTKNIGKIVSSIQFHDITRQQMEHTAQALDDIQNEIKGDNELDELSNRHLGITCDVYELQSIQLSNTLNEFVNAISTIVASLNSVGDNVASIISHSFELLCYNNGSKKNCLELFKEELAVISSGLLNNIKIGTQLSDSIKSIISIVDDLSLYVNEIEEVGSEIEIIALNARVKAAHFGTNGSALGVLAESIQRLSFEAKQQTGSTSTILVAIISESQKLRMDLESQSGTNANNRIVQIIDQINNLLDSMEKVETETSGKAEILKDKVNGLLSHINAANNQITIHETASNIVTPIIGELKDTAEFIKNNYEIDSNKKENTKQNFSKYTMLSERMIHENFSESQTTQVLSITKATNHNEVNNSLGDNVELF